jgi:F0F1-type ATP synthase assembly protein I
VQTGLGVMADDSSSEGWAAFGYPISGMIFYGGVGWLIGHFTHVAALFPIGLLIGLGIGVFAVIYRLGRRRG